MKNAIWLGTLLTLLALPLPALAGQLQATLYKNPHCSCCEAYADYLRENGFDVDVKTTDTLEEITLKAGVPEQLEGYHTMFVDGYVVVRSRIRRRRAEALDGAPADHRHHHPRNALRGAGYGWPKSGSGLNLRGEQGQGPYSLCRRVASPERASIDDCSFRWGPLSARTRPFHPAPAGTAPSAARS